MEFETFLNINDPKIREIVETYRRISSVYQRIKAAQEQIPGRKPTNGIAITSAYIVESFGYTCSTASVRF